MIGKDNTVKSLIPLIEGCLGDKKWRFKLTIAENIPRFYRVGGEHKEFLEKVVSTLLKDHNFAVREQVLKSISELKAIISSEQYY